MNDMASVTKKPKLDSNGAAHEEIVGVCDEYVCIIRRRYCLLPLSMHVRVLCKRMTLGTRPVVCTRQVVYMNGVVRAQG